MDLQLDYQPLFIIVAWFVGTAITVGIGIMFIRKSQLVKKMMLFEISVTTAQAPKKGACGLVRKFIGPSLKKSGFGFNIEIFVLLIQDLFYAIILKPNTIRGVVSITGQICKINNRC